MHLKPTAALALIFAASWGAAPCPAQNAPAQAAPAAETPAQPKDAKEAAKEAPAQPKFKFTESNLEAMALAGVLYRALRRAHSYSGRLVMTKRLAKEGQPTTTKTVVWNSTWIATDGAPGAVEKSLTQATFTTTVGDGATAKSTVERLVQVEDGKTRKRYDPDRNTWKEETQTDDNTDMSAVIASTAWTMTLLAFNMGDEFHIREEQKNGRLDDYLVANATGRTSFVADAATGRMRSWRIDNGEGEVSEFQWTNVSIDQPLPATAFNWAPPAGAKLVPADGSQREFVF